MGNRFSMGCFIATFTAAVFLSGGCSKEPTATGELEKAAAALAKADKGAPPAAKDSATPAPSKQVEEALEEYKAGKFEDAVTRLQMLRATPVMSPEQRMALQDSVAAVMREIYELAEKGDSRAIAAKARYEQLQKAR